MSLASDSMSMTAALGGLGFERPAWLIGLLLVPLAIVLWRRAQVGRGGWRRIVDPRLLPYVVEARSRVQPLRGGLKTLAVFTVLGGLIVTAAGPNLPGPLPPLERVPAPLVIAAEIGPALAATDLPPNRAAQLRFELADLLRERRGGQLGLIAYAGEAFTVSPMTDDAATLAELAAALSPDLMPVDGHNAAEAIAAAVDLMNAAGFGGGDILLIAHRSDDDAKSAAREALEAGFRTHVLMLGTAAGAPLVGRDGGFVRDASGGLILAALDREALTAIARAGGGHAELARAGSADLEALGVLDARPVGAGRGIEETVDALGRRAIGPWLLLALLPFGALLFRRGVLPGLAVVVLLPVFAAPRPVGAATLDWLKNREQRAFEALTSGEPARAAELSANSVVDGLAAYRLGDFAGAEKLFAQSAGPEADYNRGNALAQQRRFDAAIAAYDAVLDLDPEHEDARYNRELLQKLRDAAEQDPQQGEGEQGEGSDESGQGDPQQQSGDGSGEETKPAKPGDEQNGSAGDDSDPAGEKPSDEGDQPEESAGKQDQRGDESDDNQDSDAGSGAGKTDPTKEPSQPDKPADPSSTEDNNAEPQADPADAASGEPERDEAAEAEHARQMAEALADADPDNPSDEPPSQAVLSPAEQAQQEQDQAIEQWLLRIPDDPGALLRRKFQLEHEARRRGQQGRQR